jgi:uncharacterized membrane protein
MHTRVATEVISEVIELGGVAMLVGGLLAALLHSVGELVAHRQGDSAYRTLRRDIGKAILLGLEFLVAADIVRSIAITVTFQSVGLLGLIVLVRTFLSWSLEVEVTGRWPWKRAQTGLSPRPDHP